MHGAVIGHAAEGLRRHRTLQRVEVLVDRRRKIEGADGEVQRVVENYRVEGIAEIPGQRVQVAVDVATATGRLAIARGQIGVVHEDTARHHLRRLGIGQPQVAGLRATRQIDDGDAVVGTGQHVELAAGLVQGETGWPAASDDDVVARARREGVVVHLAGRKDRHLVRPLRSEINRAAVIADDESARQGQTVGLYTRRCWRHGVVDVLVQVPGLHGIRHRIDHRYARLVLPAEHGGERAAGTDQRARALEAHLVLGLGVGHIELARRTHRHIKQHGAHMGVGRYLHGRTRIGIDREYVLVRQAEADHAIPVAAQLVDPVRPNVANDQAHLRLNGAAHGAARGVGGRQSARRRLAADRAGSRCSKAVADRAFIDRRRLVAGVENRRVDTAAVRRHRQSAGRVTEQGEDGQRRAPEERRPRLKGSIEGVGVEHPDVCPADALRGQVLGGVMQRIDRGAILAPVRRGDEGPVATWARKDDVAGLVAHQQCAPDHRHGAARVDDADAVGEVIDDPDLATGTRGDRDRLQANGHGGGKPKTARQDVEDLEAVVGRVDSEEARPVGRQGQRADLPGLESDERSRLTNTREGKQAAEKAPHQSFH